MIYAQNLCLRMENEKKCQQKFNENCFELFANINQMHNDHQTTDINLIGHFWHFQKCLLDLKLQYLNNHSIKS